MIMPEEIAPINLAGAQVIAICATCSTRLSLVTRAFGVHSCLTVAIGMNRSNEFSFAVRCRFQGKALILIPLIGSESADGERFV
jgi:hypothetical protein